MIASAGHVFRREEGRPSGRGPRGNRLRGKYELRPEGYAKERVARECASRPVGASSRGARTGSLLYEKRRLRHVIVIAAARGAI